MFVFGFKASSGVSEIVVQSDSIDCIFRKNPTEFEIYLRSGSKITIVHRYESICECNMNNVREIIEGHGCCSGYNIDCEEIIVN